MTVEKYFCVEADRVTAKLIEKKEACTLMFSLVTDTHLSDTRDETRENISRVDEKVNFSFMVHMGDFLTGGIPEKVSLRLLNEEMEYYKNSISARKMFIMQGNHDGYRNEAFKGQLVDNIIFDDIWYEETAFLDSYENVSRPFNKPYYYVDLPENRVRMIFLCSAYYEYNEAVKEYRKHLGFDNQQAKWFSDTALNMEEGCTVMVFSHIAPLFELGGVSGAYNMSEKNGGKMVTALKNASKRKKFDIACWFSGDSHADMNVKLYDVNFVTTASQAPYIPQLWQMKLGAFPKNRDLKTVNQDLWDSVILNTKKRCIHIFRFGAGEDRIITY